MIKLGAYDLTNNVPFGGVSDGVTTVQNGQSYTSASGVDVTRIKGGHNTYTLTLQRLTPLQLSQICRLINNDDFKVEINGEEFTGTITDISTQLTWTDGQKEIWAASVSVSDINTTGGDT